MQAPSCLPHVAGILLLAANTTYAAAETPLPDPVAPAVIGRPLDQIRPARPAGPKPSAAKATRPKQMVPVAGKAVPSLTEVPVVTAPPMAAPAVAQAAPPGQPKPQRDRDAAQVLEDNVGQGPVAGMQANGPGIFFGGRQQAVIRKFYEAHPAPGRASSWKIGETVPSRAKMTGVPDGVRAALPPVPPGHQYVQLDDEVVLVAVPSRMVVDGVSRAVR